MSDCYGVTPAVICEDACALVDYAAERGMMTQTAAAVARCKLRRMFDQTTEEEEA